MDLAENNIYHIYNQGNNRQQIFFNRSNKKLFLEKIRKHVLPHADVLAWCLMPNHFHLMIYVNRIIPESKDSKVLQLTLEKKNEKVSDVLIQPQQPRHCSKDHTLNYSIGILLSSYSQIVNKQEGRSGSLFRNNTKSECIKGL